MPKDVVPSSAIWNLLLSLVVIFAHLQVVTCFSELGCENKKQSTHVNIRQFRLFGCCGANGHKFKKACSIVPYSFYSVNIS